MALGEVGVDLGGEVVRFLPALVKACDISPNGGALATVLVRVGSASGGASYLPLPNLGSLGEMVLHPQVANKSNLRFRQKIQVLVTENPIAEARPIDSQ